MQPKLFILDVDGVMTDGKFYYTAEGKIMKIFGADDSDALGLLKKHLEIRFITGDKKGFSISKKRIVDDMGYKLDLVSTINRLEWLKGIAPLDKIIFMGDGIFDHYALKEVGYAIVPSNGDKNAKSFANFVTERDGGDRAVAEACLHILNEFFEGYDLKKNLSPNDISGEWAQ